MRYEVNLGKSFQKAFKRLHKKYHSLDDDLEELINELEQGSTRGADLGHGLRKVRMTITDKSKGKSHGARVITHTAIISIQKGIITLLAIYDKEEQDTITRKEISQLLKELKEQK